MEYWVDFGILRDAHASNVECDEGIQLMNKVSSFLHVRKQCLFRDGLGSLLAIVLTVTNFLPLYAQAPDSSVFKSDTPKLDTSIQKQTLKGGIQHNEAPPVTPPPRKLSAGASSGTAKLVPGAAKTDLLHKLFKSKIDKQPPLTAQVQSSIGIIGVKFVLGFGRPPVINRVFPGTPAQQSGLRLTT